MNRIQIFLVRHGQDTDNEAGILNGRRDTELTQLGREQAKVAVTKLKDKQIGFIYSSPLKRALHTAQLIAKELKLPVHIDEKLIERDFGILTGKPVEDIPKYARQIISVGHINYFLDGEGTEPFPAALQRAEAFIKAVATLHQDQHILVVSHGDFCKMIQAVCNGWMWEEALHTPYFDNTNILELQLPNQI